MWTRLSDWIYRISTGRITFAALLVFLLFMVFVLPNQTTTAGTENRDAGSPDSSFFYTADDLYAMAGAYGEVGRQAYIRARFTFDLIWPLVYMVFLATAISWVYQRAFAPGTLWRRANLVPVLGALFDYLENLSTSLVMWRYPDPTPLVDTLAGIFTSVKWIFVTGSFVLLLIGVIVGVVRWVVARAKR